MLLSGHNSCECVEGRILCGEQEERVCLLFLCSPGNIVRPRSCAVLLHQLLDHFTRVVQLVKVVLEHVLLAELLQEGFAFPQLVILPTGPLEQLQPGDASELHPVLRITSTQFINPPPPARK